MEPDLDVLTFRVGLHEPRWVEWAKEYVASGEFAKKLWLTERWITADEAVFRYGIPRFHVIELAGYWQDQVPWRHPDDPDECPRFDTKVFARNSHHRPRLLARGRPGQLSMAGRLREKQSTFIARQYQRALGLSHVLPTAWQRVLEDFP